MSGKLVGLVFDFFEGSGSDLLLAVKLADNAHDDGTRIFPSVATLARQTRQSDRTVQRQLGRMMASGWLVLVREARGGGRGGGPGRAREYRIHPNFVGAFDARIPEADRPAWPLTPVKDQGSCAPEMGDKLAPICSEKRVTSGAEMGDIAMSEMGDTVVSPEPSGTVSNNTPQPPKVGAPGFDAVFAEYPRQIAKPRARQVWQQLNPDAPTQQAMLKAIHAWRADPAWQREQGRFIPKFDRWLRERRWQDVPGVAAPPTPAAAPYSPEPPAGRPSDAVRAQMVSILAQAGRRRPADASATAAGAAEPVEVRA